MSEPLLYFNGIDDDTGDYALPPRIVGEFAELVERVPRPQGVPKRLKFGLDPLDLADTGWGVVWPENVDAEIREALAPLLELRREQATRRQERTFQELTYFTDESALEFWRRHGLGPDSVDPEKMPYYLLIVGPPDDVAFDFQFELGIPYAVGRLCFDTAEDYATYAQNIVKADNRTLPESPTMAFWAVQNPDDPPTRWSVEDLVKPLEQSIADGRPDWRVETCLRRAADKDQLVRLLTGADSPTILFTASHAIRCRAGTQRQLSHQGALLCADWPGPKAWKGGGPMPDDFLFTGRDVADGPSLDGLIAFHFACYSAGTPHLDSYARVERSVAAPSPFIANLPKQMLRRGALAVIGHVDVAMEHSFLWHEAGRQIETFDSTLRAIMAGHPVGHAMDHFGQRFGLLGALTALNDPSSSDQGETEDDDLRRFQLWTAFQDARNYIILGDPAVRLNVES